MAKNQRAQTSGHHYGHQRRPLCCTEFCQSPFVTPEGVEPILRVSAPATVFEELRVTSSVYTLIEELDRFVEAMLHAAQYGISA